MENTYEWTKMVIILIIKMIYLNNHNIKTLTNKSDNPINLQINKSQQKHWNRGYSNTIGEGYKVEIKSQGSKGSHNSKHVPRIIHRTVGQRVQYN